MSTYSRSSVGAAPAGPLTAIGGIALLINVVGLFAFTGLAVAIFGYIGVTVLLVSFAGLWSPTTRAGHVGVGFLVLSWLAALAAGVCVGAFHWVKFPYAAYATLGCYGLAVMIWVCGRVLSFVAACLFILFGASLLAAVTCLPAPPGGEEANDSRGSAKFLVHFVDAAGRPVEGVAVWFDLKWRWQDDPSLRKEPDRVSNRIDGNRLDGAVDYWMVQDPRLRTFVMRAQRGPQPYTHGFTLPPDRDGASYYHPAEHGNVGYEDMRRELPVPERGETYEVQIELKERLPTGR